MRIALVFQSVGRGTVDWSGVPAGLADGLRAAGHEPVLVPLGIPYAVRRAADLLAVAGYRMRGLGAMTPTTVAWRTRSAHHLLRAPDRPDRVVLMGTTFEIPRDVPYVTFDDMTVGQFARLRGIPRRVATPWAARQARAVRDSSACCVTCGWVSEALEREYGIACQRIAEVGLGANVTPEPDERRDWSVPRFLFIGFDWERKGGRRAIEAFRVLRSEHPDATLDLIGPIRGIEEPGVTEHGWIDMRTPMGRERLVAAYRRATCFVMPSEWEPFGIVHAEAGLAGVPSIGTTVGGAAYAIGPGGITVAPNDQDGLIAAMRSLADPDTARRLGALAAKHARRFTWENVARGILERLDVSPVAPRAERT